MTGNARLQPTPRSFVIRQDIPEPERYLEEMERKATDPVLLAEIRSVRALPPDAQVAWLLDGLVPPDRDTATDRRPLSYVTKCVIVLVTVYVTVRVAVTGANNVIEWIEKREAQIREVQQCAQVPAPAPDAGDTSETPLSSGDTVEVPITSDTSETPLSDRGAP